MDNTDSATVNVAMVSSVNNKTGLEIIAGKTTVGPKTEP